MDLPYVIDNEEHRLLDILVGLLTEHRGRSLDVATAYFTVGGYALLAEGLASLGNLRLLLGAEPLSGEQVGLRPERSALKAALSRDLNALPFAKVTLRQVEELIRYLRREAVQVRVAERVFLHAKAWIFYADRPGQQLLFDRFRPVLAIVGSSNFTIPGLTSNRELNLAHKVMLDSKEVEDPPAAEAVRWLSDQRPSERITNENRQLLKSEVGARAIIDLERWFERQWSEAAQFKEELIALLDASKFGTIEYTPYQVYLKSLYEYFRDSLAETPEAATRSAVELAEFQEDAVKRARAILARYDGVLIADSVGLGKTWIGKKLLEDYAYHLRQKALVVCPAALRETVWQPQLEAATIAARVVSQEELGRPEFDPSSLLDVDVVLIDESHNLRNPNSQRYQALEEILQARGGRGAAGSRKKVILLTATPINNDLFDLYHQLQLVTGGDRAYFAAAGIGDLERYFRSARSAGRGEAGLALFNLLEEIAIRRTRQFIREAYPEATIRGERIRFPERVLRTVRYDLEATYGGIYDEVVVGVESLKLAPYNLESYKRAEVERDKFELGREEALVGIFKSRYLKRFESSVHAFRVSVRRALSFLKTFESLLLDGKLLRSKSFHRALRVLDRESEDEEDVPRSLAGDLEEDAEARILMGELDSINPTQFDLRRLHDALQHDIEVLTGIWYRVKDMGSATDAKLLRLKALLRSPEFAGKKCLIFSYYRDTVRFLYRQLGHPENPEAAAFCEALGGVRIRRLDSGADRKERLALVKQFAPVANGRPEWTGTDREIDILISTDVLAEGQNLQDCGILINYDLHWNPTRMVQRAGRIDRIGSAHEILAIYNMFPDEGLERLLRLVERLAARIAAIDRQGFLDASVLGEEVHPQNFNTLRRIAAEDAAILVEEERFAELASSEGLEHQLKAYLAAHGEEVLRDLPDGIHSGHRRPGSRGVFFHFSTTGQKGRRHFWRFVEASAGRTLDNRLLISRLIACGPETARVIDADLWDTIFELQERAADDILTAVRSQQALDEAPPIIDPVQQVLATTLRSLLSHSGVARQRVLEVLRFLRQPLRRTAIRALRDAHRIHAARNDAEALLTSVEELKARVGNPAERSNEQLSGEILRREDLHLVCFELITG